MCVSQLTRKGDPAIRTPQVIQSAGNDTDQVVFESYDDLNYGYLRVVATATQLRIEYHAASPSSAITSDPSFTCPGGQGGRRLLPV